MNAGLVHRSQAPLVRGGRRVEHPLARAPIVAPYSVTQGYRWIGDAILPPGEKALLVAIFKLVDSKTWRWPPRTGDGGGSAVADLGLMIARSVRQTRRLIRALEERGVLAVADRRPFRSEYQILPEALRALGEAGKAAGIADRAERRARHRSRMDAADAALDRREAQGEEVHHEAEGEDAGPDFDLREDASPAPAVAAEPSAEPAPDALPSWALSAGRKHKLEPALVAGLVRSLWRAAGGTGSWLHEGALARPALRCWRHINQPSAAAWDRLCAGFASAWHGGRLRGSFPKGWAWTPRGLVELLRLPWARALAELEAARPAPPQAPPTAAPASAPAATPAGLRVVGELVGPPGARVPPDLTNAQLQAELGRRRATVASYVFDCFLAPLRLIDVQDGIAVVDAGSKVGAVWIGDNEDTRAALVGAAGGPVRLVASA
jgi:hypothetical protein